MFAENLKAVMKEQNVSQKELCDMTGISASSMSQYLAGKNKPRKDGIKSIADALKCSVIDLTYVDRPTRYISDTESMPGAFLTPGKMTVKDAARLLGKSTQFVRSALQQNIAPFGFAVKGRGNKWVYHISPGKLFEYLRGA